MFIFVLTLGTKSLSRMEHDKTSVYYYLDTKPIFSTMRRYNNANMNGGECSMNVGSLMDKCKSIQLGNQKSIVKEADD